MFKKYCENILLGLNEVFTEIAFIRKNFYELLSKHSNKGYTVPEEFLEDFILDVMFPEIESEYISRIIIQGVFCKESEVYVMFTKNKEENCMPLASFSVSDQLYIIESVTSFIENE